MAPERRHHEETKLGDVYWLSCVLWETLAGPGSHLPGRSATAQDAGVAGWPAVRGRAVGERTAAQALAVRWRARSSGAVGTKRSDPQRALGLVRYESSGEWGRTVTRNWLQTPRVCRTVWPSL